MQNVILTGATGFIGRWFVNECLNNGINVTAIVRDKKRLDSEFVDNSCVTIIETDIGKADISMFDKSVKYDCFYHLAWDGTSADKKNDINLQLNNIHVSLKALELSKQLKSKLFIATGTVAEYVFSKNVIDLDAKQTPNDMYGAAKTSAHYFLEIYARQLQQDMIWAVLPSTFGEYRKDNNIITYTICSLLKGEIPMFGNLEQMWDFLYVSEVVRALRLLGENGVHNTTYGIGSGVHRPLKYYISMIRDFIDPRLELGIGQRPDMSNITFSSCIDIERLTRDTGFIPRVEYKDGIERTINYWKKQMGID